MKLFNSLLVFTAIFFLSSQSGYVAERPTDSHVEAKQFFSSGTNEKLSALRLKVLGIKHLIENDGVLENNEERLELTPEQLAESMENLVNKLDTDFSQLATSTDQESLYRVKKALEEFRTVKEKKFPQDKAEIQSLIRKLASEILGTEHALYAQFAISTPSDPQLGMNWMIEALNFWHMYLFCAEPGDHVALFERIDWTVGKLTKELETINLSDDQKGDMMVALLSLCNLDTFKGKVRGKWAERPWNVKSYLPKPLPQAALLFSWAQFDDTRAGILLKTASATAGDQISHLIKSSCDKTLRAAEILETQDTVPTDLLSALMRPYQTITQGITRYLAIEFLLETYRGLKKYELPGLLDPKQLSALKQQLAERALKLTEDMQFSREMGDESKFYQMWAFLRLSVMYENPIQKYMYRLVANRIYQPATYGNSADQLASYFQLGNSFARAFYLKREQKALSETATNLCGEAYKAAFQEAESYFQSREKAQSVHDRLVALAKADVMAILAANIAGEMKPEEPTEGTSEKPTVEEKIDTANLAALKASVDQELSTLLGDLIEKHTREFDEALLKPVEEDTSFKGRLERAKSLRSEFLKLIETIQGNFYSTVKIYDHHKLAWKFEPNSNIRKALELVDQELSTLLGDLIEKHTREFDEALPQPEEEDTSFKGRLVRANSLRSEFLKLIETTQGNFNSTVKIPDHHKLAWKCEPNSNIRRAHELCESQQKKIRAALASRIDKRVDSYRKRAEAGECPQTLAAEYEQELLRWKEEVNEIVPLWDKTGLIPELLVRAKIQAIAQAKKPDEVNKLHREVRDFLQGLRPKFPQVYNSYEQAARQELWAQNYQRVAEGQKPLTLEEFQPTKIQQHFIGWYGWIIDEQGPIPEGWAKGLSAQTKKVDAAVLSFLKNYSCVLSEPGLEACRRTLAEFEFLASWLGRVRDRENPYNLLSLGARSEDVFSRCAPSDSHKLYETMCHLERKYSVESNQKFNALFQLVSRIETTKIKISDLAQLLKEIDELLSTRGWGYDCSFASKEYPLALKKWVVEVVLKKCAELPADDFLREIKQVSKSLGRQSTQYLEGPVKGKLLPIFQERKKHIEQKIKEAAAELKQEAKLVILEEVAELVAAYEGLCDQYFGPRYWGSYSLKLDDSVSIIFDRSVIELSCSLDSLRGQIRYTQQKVSEILKSAKLQAAQEERIQAAAQMKAGQEARRKTIQESYAPQLEEIRKRANAVKEEAKSDEEKYEQYSSVRNQASKFLEALNLSDYRQDVEVGKIRADLEEILRKLNEAIKKYSKKP